MRIADLIMHLAELEEEHGGDTGVMIDHGGIGDMSFVPAENGCPAYISIESE